MYQGLQCCMMLHCSREELNEPEIEPVADPKKVPCSLLKKPTLIHIVLFILRPTYSFFCSNLLNGF